MQILEDNTDDICCFCLDPLSKYDLVKNMRNCKHTFHSNCLLDFYIHKDLIDSEKCPMCRKHFDFDFQLSEIITLNCIREEQFNVNVFDNIIQKYYDDYISKKKFFDQILKSMSSKKYIYYLNCNNIFDFFSIVSLLILYILCVIIAVNNTQLNIN